MNVVVVGGGVAGLVAARDFAHAGHAVTVFEASSTWGGALGKHQLAGLTLDSGAESFATRTDAVANLASELGLGEHIVRPLPGGAWVQLPQGPRELPKTGVLGIPANPWDPEVRRTLGWWGSLRASMDTLMPPAWGTEAELSSVAELVQRRMGQRVLKRLVEPVVGGVHAASAALLDVDMVAPGLRPGIQEQGSLAKAVKAQRARPAAAGSAVAGISGGMHRLVESLLEDLRKHRVVLQRGLSVVSMSRTDGSQTDLTLGQRADDDGTTVEGSAAEIAPLWRVRTTQGEALASHVVVALDGPNAVDLLAPSIPEMVPFRPGAGPNVKLVTLVVRAPKLDARPRGTGILVAPQRAATPGEAARTETAGTSNIRAKALTHVTGKWEWTAQEAAAAVGPGTHVLRLSYGRQAEANSDAAATVSSVTNHSDEELLEIALADATALLGVPLVEADVEAWDVVTWQGALPFAAVGHKNRVAQVRQLARGQSGLSVIGAWLAGTGLAAVVADARAAVRGVIEQGT
ncbi:protoporphyrinogen/coproporphyrinogen oxidase [Pseudarthrobacter sp. J1738]|uniref:protoporphyrinogen/coproporphyrinogen oxidase n=1 Tax=Pseudarthrobacter sp. J1738 TaxID=3420446 RepID=UPI003D2BFF64